MAKYVKTEDGYQEIEELNSNKMDKNNPVGTGSFSMGRKVGSVIGNSSHAEGYNTTASGEDSHAEGKYTTASGNTSHAESIFTKASGIHSHAEGNGAIASGNTSHAEGFATKASGEYQHVQGKFNIEDTNNKYSHIVGNGANINKCSNAHTLDWSGNAWFAGDVKVGGTGQDDIAAKTLATTEDIPVVDGTLTVSGAAADSKETGDAIRSLSDEIVTTAASQVAAHNTGTDTHNDIRVLIQGLTDRLNALADSDDTTLDQLSEIVAYIKSNRTLIEAITTSKVSVADIVDNLTTNATNKPLSAAQGVVIKTLIDALRNDKLDAAELTNAINTALAQAKASGEFDGADGAPGADGKSAYAYAVEGGYTGTEAEFAAKLAQEMPDKLPNPNALTFTGAVTGSYDGSEPLSVKIPAGGGGSGGVNYTLAVDVLASGTVAAGSTGAVDTGVKLSDLKQYKLFIVSVSGASNKSLTNWYTKLGSLCINRVNGSRAKTILYEFLNDNKNLLFPRIGTAGNHGVYSSYIGNGISYGTNNNAQFPDCIYDLSSIGDDNSIIIQPTSATIDVNWCIMGVAK